jgi:hypothetical protein
VPTLADFLLHPTKTFAFSDDPGRPGKQKARELEAFLLAFPSGLAPAVGQQVTLARELPADAMERWHLLAGRAAVGDGDLVVHGQHRGRERGWLQAAASRGEFTYLADRAVERHSLAELFLAVSDEGAILTAMLVPPGSGRRIGIDRDEDGALDGDEVDLGFDPANPWSHPPPGPRLLSGDCSADGGLDITDAVFLLGFLFQGGAPPPCAWTCDANGDGPRDVSDAVYVLRFLFLGGPAPGAYPRCEPAPEGCADTCGG